MKKIICRRLVALILILLLLFGTTVYIYAASSASIVAADISGTVNEQVAIPVSLYASNSSVKISGFSLSISFDSEKLQYVTGSEHVICSELKENFTLYSPEASKVNVVWYGDSTSIKSGTSLFGISFKILPGTEGQKIPVTIKISSLYDYSIDNGKAVLTDIPLSTNPVVFNVTVGSGNGNGAVKAVIDKISALGTPLYTQEYMNKLAAAVRAYAMLSDAQKNQVTNYSDLIAAQNGYEAAKQQSKNAVLEKKITDFKNANPNWERTVAIDISAVKADDEKIISDCQKIYKTITDTDLQYALFSDYRKLKALSDQIGNLKDEEKIVQEKNEAEQMAAQLKEEYAYWINLDSEKITEEYWQGLNAAVEMFENLMGGNPYLSGYLSSEFSVLKSNLEIAEELKLKNGDEGDINEVAAAQYKRSFSYLLSLNTSDITYDEYMDLKIAAEVYKMQNSKVQNLLSGEYDKIKEFLLIAEGLESDNNDSDNDTEIGNPETIKVTETKFVRTGGTLDNFLVNFSNRGIGVVVFILMLILAVSVFTFVGLKLFYYIRYVKKNKTEVDDIE